MIYLGSARNGWGRLGLSTNLLQPPFLVQNVCNIPAGGGARAAGTFYYCQFPAISVISRVCIDQSFSFFLHCTCRWLFYKYKRLFLQRHDIFFFFLQICSYMRVYVYHILTQYMPNIWSYSYIHILKIENAMHRLSNIFVAANMFPRSKLHQEHEYQLYFCKFNRVYVQFLRKLIHKIWAEPSALTRMMTDAHVAHSLRRSMFQLYE